MNNIIRLTINGFSNFSHPRSNNITLNRWLLTRKDCFSSWQGHGTDLLSDSLSHNTSGGIPKVILHGHSSSGFDVVNIIKNMDPTDEDLQKSGGIVHMAGSILAFPDACFLWNVRDAKDINMDTLAPIQLYRPQLEYLFLGCAEPILPSVIQKLRQDFEKTNPKNSPGLVIEPMHLANAMGTFNILNGEDRLVAAALILPRKKNKGKRYNL